jgi:hypothetical protein
MAMVAALIARVWGSAATAAHEYRRCSSTEPAAQKTSDPRDDIIPHHAAPFSVHRWRLWVRRTGQGEPDDDIGGSGREDLQNAGSR